MNFSYLSEYLCDSTQRSPARIRSKIGEMSDKTSEIVSSVSANFTGSRLQKRRIIDIVNSQNTAICLGDTFTYDVSYLNDFHSIYSDDDMKQVLGSAYVSFDSVTWDIDIAYSSTTSSGSDHSSTEKEESDTKSVSDNNFIISSSVQLHSDSSSEEYHEYRTSREDISFQFPKFPRFDPKQIWGLCEDDGGRVIPIYKSLPEIPEKQNEITITTEWKTMTDSEFMRLYPDHTINTRRDEMYIKRPGYDYDDLVGFVPKISGFSRDQIIDNIIKYPQFNFMYRYVNGKRISFMKHIEVDGKLLTLDEAINEVDDMQLLPDNKVFYWDYIVRRYLLERDNCIVDHKYPLIGYFHPFITLFTTPSIYKSRGYNDVLDMAKQCVRCRVLFYQSRNPLTRRLFE